MNGEPIATATLAELYIRQGHAEQGISMLRKLAADNPGNEQFSNRLAELARRDETMGFREYLERIRDEVEGVLSCTLMAVDGIPIDTVTVDMPAPAYDLQNTMVEFAGQLGNLQRSSESLGSGGVEEYFIKTDQVMVLMRPVTGEYFLGLTMAPGGNIGKGRYLLRVIAPKLVSELT